MSQFNFVPAVFAPVDGSYFLISPFLATLSFARDVFQTASYPIVCGGCRSKQDNPLREPWDRQINL